MGTNRVQKMKNMIGKIISIKAHKIELEEYNQNNSLEDKSVVSFKKERK